jgi:DNA-binding response OmpR family regulator
MKQYVQYGHCVYGIDWSFIVGLNVPSLILLAGVYVVRIGLLEDDVSLIEIISLWVEEAGDHLKAYTTGSSFREGIATDNFDVLVLDWNLPDTTGVDELDWLRSEKGSDTPVIFMTSRDDEKSIVEALNHGADDYMVKPVNREVALARINALHRRHKLGVVASKIENEVNGKPKLSGGIEEYEPYQINHSERSISINGQAVKLTNKEFELAAFMFRNASSLISRDELLEYIWGTSADLNTRTVDTHISRIRSKLGMNTDVGWQLNSIYQCGYRLYRVH